MIFRSLPPRKDRNTYEFRQACAANREEHGGRQSGRGIIVGKFASYLLIDGAPYFLFDASNMISKRKKALGQSGLPRADWIAKTLLAAATQMP